MTALAHAYDARRRDGALLAYPVAAGGHVFKGGLVAVSAAGFAQPAADAAGLTFVGVAYEDADNRLGAAGARTVRVLKTGVYNYAKAGAVMADTGKTVYAVDDATVSVAATGSGLAAGVVVGVPDVGHVCVRIDGKVS